MLKTIKNGLKKRYRSSFFRRFQIKYFYFHYAKPFFSEEWYLQAYPFVNKLIENGKFESAWAHYKEVGVYHRFSMNSMFNEIWYLDQNPDVANIVENKGVRCGFEHWLAYGEVEGRVPSLLFDNEWYINKYYDIQKSIENNIILSGFRHYLLLGRKEGRYPSPYVEQLSNYLGQSPDNIIIETFLFKLSLKKFPFYQTKEIRIPSNLINHADNINENRGKVSYLSWLLQHYQETDFSFVESNQLDIMQFIQGVLELAVANQNNIFEYASLNIS